MSQPDDTTADGPAIQRDLADAFAGVLARHERSMVGHWVALVETIDEHGKRGLWTFTSDDVKAWDTVGLLGHAMHLQQAETLAVRLAGEPE